MRTSGLVRSSQLYLVGIETTFKTKNNTYTILSQLYLVGIETNNKSTSELQKSRSQLYLVGIETRKRYKGVSRAPTLNCTLLELKRTNDQEPSAAK